MTVKKDIGRSVSGRSGVEVVWVGGDRRFAARTPRRTRPYWRAAGCRGTPSGGAALRSSRPPSSNQRSM